MFDSNKVELNIARAGEFFMYCLWLQGQMADLLIFKKHPEFVADFVAHPKTIPHSVVERRAGYWEMGFGAVKADFLREFRAQLTSQDVEDLGVVFHLRNIIGHCHVSIGRDYLLYRPSSGKKEQEVVGALGLQSKVDQATPTMMTIRLYDDERYRHDFNRIKRLDKSCFGPIAASLGVPHGRIR